MLSPGNGINIELCLGLSYRIIPISDRRSEINLQGSKVERMKSETLERISDSERRVANPSRA